MAYFRIACLSLLVAAAAHAENEEAGRTRAQVCAVCHGQFGISVDPAAPNLAGQPAAYLVEQLRNFRSGKRENPVMSVIAKPLSDEDIDALARWYASIEIEVKQP